jgi:hypothetical protein
MVRLRSMRPLRLRSLRTLRRVRLPLLVRTAANRYFKGS